MEITKKKLFKIVKWAKKGTFCLRCGTDKKEIQREKFGCASYGTFYGKRHIYK